MANHSGADKVVTLPALQTFKQSADNAYSPASHTHGQTEVTGAVWYGTCGTAASTQVKVVTCSSFPASALKAGTILIVKFTNQQTYNGAPILNVNGTGNVDVKVYGTTASARYEWYKGEVVQFVHDGTNWIITQRGRATTSYYGVTKLNQSLVSTSSSVATTPYAVNKAMEVLTGLPIYSASSTYAVGDRVRYSEGIWQCTTAISTAEAWNADHWTQIANLLSMIDGKAPTSHTHTTSDITNMPTIPSAGTSSPAMDGNASVGSSSAYSRADHVHPTDTSRAAAASVPDSGSISSTGLISIKHGSTTLFTIQLPLYSGGVS